MKNVYGIVYAYHAFPALGELGRERTGASLPFCGRYRLIDFAMSGLMNAGVFNVGVIMQRGYLSLMEHLGGGRPWNMSRTDGGLHLLPPYGLWDAGKGVYGGCMEALDAVSTHLHEIREEYVLLTRGDLCANVDMRAVIETHLASGADITAVCTERTLPGVHHSFILGADGGAAELLCRQSEGEGLSSLETYVMRREKLLEMVEWCHVHGKLHFHRDALRRAMDQGWRVGVYLHDGYARHITSVQDFYEANMDMLCAENRAQLFPADRRVATRARSDVSTYYGDGARVRSSLVADGCRIEGEVDECVVFPGVRIGAGSALRRCVVLNDCVIGEGSTLRCAVADKNVTVSQGLYLSGNEKLPLVIPKGSKI